MKSLPSDQSSSNLVDDHEAGSVLAPPAEQPPRGKDVRDLALLAAVRAAGRGDVEAARRLLGRFSEAVSTGQPVPEPLQRYVADACSRYLQGEVPSLDKAFGVKRSRRGRPPTSAPKRYVEDMATAWEYDALLEEGHNRTSALAEIPLSERTIDRRRRRAKRGS